MVVNNRSSDAIIPMHRSSLNITKLACEKVEFLNTLMCKDDEYVFIDAYIFQRGQTDGGKSSLG